MLDQQTRSQLCASMAPFEEGSSSNDILIDHSACARMESPLSPSEDEESVPVALQSIFPRLSHGVSIFRSGDDTLAREQLQLVTLRSALASAEDRHDVLTSALEEAQQQVLKLQKCVAELKAALASRAAKCSCCKVIRSDDK